MFDLIISKLKEPGTLYGFSGLALAVGISAPEYQAICGAIAGLAGLIAIFRKG